MDQSIGIKVNAKENVKTIFNKKLLISFIFVEKFQLRGAFGIVVWGRVVKHSHNHTCQISCHFVHAVGSHNTHNCH